MLTRPLHASTPTTRGATRRLSPGMSIALLVVLFAVVYALRTSFFNPNDGLGLFFCLPIAFAAVRFGPAVGVGAGVVGFALFVVWAMDGHHGGIGLVGYVSRLTVFLLLGGLIGYFARAREELDVRSRLLFDLSPDIMGTLDLDGRLVAVNDAWRLANQQAGASSAVPTDWSQHVPQPGGSTAFEQAFSTGDDQRRTIEWFVRRDPRRPLLYVVGRDVTERKEQSVHVRELLGAVQDAAANERARVSSQLHDFVLQPLLVSLMHLDLLAESEQGAAAAKTDRFVRDGMTALRRVIDGIQPLDLGHLDCATVLDRSASSVEDEWDVAIARTIDVTGALDEERTQLLYRFVGEALRNAAKHAAAANIRLDARERDGWLVVEVRDDGVGLAEPTSVADALAPIYGTGFNLLLEHTLASGGRCRIDSVPGAGTTIEVSVPLRSS